MILRNVLLTIVDVFYTVFLTVRLNVGRVMLTDEELQRLEEACDMALELNQSKHRIYDYVESRMSFIAPNLSIIVGASTAAKIMGQNKKLEVSVKISNV